MMSVLGALLRVRLEHVGMQDIPSARAAGLEPATPGLETQTIRLWQALRGSREPVREPVRRESLQRPLRPSAPGVDPEQVNWLKEPGCGYSGAANSFTAFRHLGEHDRPTRRANPSINSSGTRQSKLCHGTPFVVRRASVFDLAIGPYRIASPIRTPVALRVFWSGCSAGTNPARGRVCLGLYSQPFGPFSPLRQAGPRERVGRCLTRHLRPQEGVD